MSHVRCVGVGFLVYIGRWNGSVCCLFLHTHTPLLHYHSTPLFFLSPRNRFRLFLFRFLSGLLFSLTSCSPSFSGIEFLNAFVSHFKSRFEHIYAAAFLTTDLITSGVLLRDKRHPSSAFVRSRHPLPRFYSENRSGSLLFSSSWSRSI